MEVRLEIHHGLVDRRLDLLLKEPEMVVDHDQVLQSLSKEVVVDHVPVLQSLSTEMVVDHVLVLRSLLTEMVVDHAFVLPQRVGSDVAACSLCNHRSSGDHHAEKALGLRVLRPPRPHRTARATPPDGRSFGSHILVACAHSFSNLLQQIFAQVENQCNTECLLRGCRTQSLGRNLPQTASHIHSPCVSTGRSSDESTRTTHP